MTTIATINKKRTAVQHEARLQQTCVRWFRFQFPHVLLFHIPNGGRRNAREAAFLKAEGVVAGVPDLFLAAGRSGKKGLFIEMKVGRNTETENQKRVRSQLEEAGYLCEVARSFDEFRDLVFGYMHGAREMNELINALFLAAERLGFTKEGITGECRNQPLAYVRMAIANIMLEAGCNDITITEWLHRDHSTIAYYKRQFEGEYKWNKDFRKVYDKLKDGISEEHAIGGSC
ncbi:MAG: VRR-NUC domain-containing protein [Bacteroides sp.]|nr:VRR-NUC domain-containing protein [Bacteroides sp.]